MATIKVMTETILARLLKAEGYDPESVHDHMIVLNEHAFMCLNDAEFRIVSQGDTVALFMKKGVIQRSIRLEILPQCVQSQLIDIVFPNITP